MSDMDEIFQEAAEDFLEEWADMIATYTNRDSVTVGLPCIVTIDAQLQGDDLQTIVRADTIEFLSATGHKPKRGETIFADGKTYTVESTYSRDKFWTKLIVK